MGKRQTYVKHSCSICGKPIPAGTMAEEHRCSPRSFAAIDAADARAWNGSSNLSDPMRRATGERISDGAEEQRRLDEDGWPYPYTDEGSR